MENSGTNSMKVSETFGHSPFFVRKATFFLHWWQKNLTDGSGFRLGGQTERDRLEVEAFGLAAKHPSPENFGQYLTTGVCPLGCTWPLGEMFTLLFSPGVNTTVWKDGGANKVSSPLGDKVHP
jgi:hypothetical protein